eukprot:scaffold23532_cov54-Phaeocystis_antarctica.AAC.2
MLSARFASCSAKRRSSSRASTWIRSETRTSTRAAAAASPSPAAIALVSLSSATRPAIAASFASALPSLEPLVAKPEPNFALQLALANIACSRSAALLSAARSAAWALSASAVSSPELSTKSCRSASPDGTFAAASAAAAAASAASSSFRARRACTACSVAPVRSEMTSATTPLAEST